jgi:hypothetical protein
MTVLTGFGPVLAGKSGLFCLTYRPFLPKKRLLAGRFRPALRFATRGPALRFTGWTCRHRELPGAQEGAFPQNRKPERHRSRDGYA